LQADKALIFSCCFSLTHHNLSLNDNQTSFAGASVPVSAEAPLPPPQRDNYIF
jgi:hypothetical protein